MLIGLLGNKYYDLIREVIETSEFQKANYEKKIEDTTDIEQAFEEIQRLALDILIIDFTEYKAALFENIKKYRLLKPTTRIIIFSPGSVQGDPFLSQLFVLGIYDILAPSEDENFKASLQKILIEPKNIQDAFKWYSDSTIIPAAKTERKVKQKVVKEEVVKEKVVYRDRYIGSVIVGVAGMDRGVGCTHFCLSLASFLAKDFSVAVVEFSSNPVFSVLNTNQKGNLGAFRLNEFDVFTKDLFEDDNKFLFAEILQFGYNYIILDLGRIKFFDNLGNIRYSDFYGEMLRSDFQILVGAGAIWQFRLLPNFMPDREPSTSWQLVFNFMNDIAFKNVYSIIKNSGFEKEPLKLPYNNDVFNVTDEQKKIFAKVLTLKDKRQKEKKLFGLFG